MYRSIPQIKSDVTKVEEYLETHNKEYDELYYRFEKSLKVKWNNWLSFIDPDLMVVSRRGVAILNPNPAKRDYTILEFRVTGLTSSREVVSINLQLNSMSLYADDIEYNKQINELRTKAFDFMCNKVEVDNIKNNIDSSKKELFSLISTHIKIRRLIKKQLDELKDELLQANILKFKQGFVYNELPYGTSLSIGKKGGVVKRVYGLTIDKVTPTGRFYNCRIMYDIVEYGLGSRDTLNYKRKEGSVRLSFDNLITYINKVDSLDGNDE